MYTLLQKKTKGVFLTVEFRLRMYFHAITTQCVKLVVFQVYVHSLIEKWYLILTFKNLASYI